MPDDPLLDHPLLDHPLLDHPLLADVVVLVPLKPVEQAKTRLALPRPLRERLVLAMVADVLAAAQVTPGVAELRLVGGDARVQALLAPGGRVRVVPDAGRGLDAAVAAAAAEEDRAVLVLQGDLPAVSPADLGAVLVAWDRSRGSAVVADAPGTGTVLLAAPRGALLRPAFGPQSRRRHVDLGAVDLTEALDTPGLRRDVDTLEDLAAAVRLGVGASTAALLPQVAGLPQAA